MTKAKCTLSIIPETNIIRSDPYGTWEPEDAKQNCEDILKMAAKEFGNEKWGFLSLIVNMDPITNTETSKEFSKFHDEFENEGCIATAFVVGNKVAIKAQAQLHHDTSSAKKLQVKHFHDEDKALEWLKSLKL